MVVYSMRSHTECPVWCLGRAFDLLTYISTMLAYTEQVNLK